MIESTILQLQCLLICIPNSYFVSQSTQIQPHWIHNLAVAVPPHLHSKFLFRITIHPNSTTLNPQSCSCSCSSFAFQIPISYHNPPKFNHTESTILQLQCLLICIPNSYFVSQSTQIQPHWIHNLAVAVPPHLHSKFLFRITIHPNSTTLNPQSCSCSASSFAFQIPISYHNPPKFNHTESTILQLQCLLICIPNSYFVSQSTQIQPHWIHNLAVAVPPHLHSKFLFRITIHPNSTTLNPQSCSCSASSFAFQIPISYHNPPKFNHTESTILQLQCLLICIPNSYFVSQSTQIQPHWIHNLAVAVPPHLHSKFLFRITIHPNSTTLNPQSCSCSASSFAFQIPISYHNPPKFNHTESTILQLQCLLICIPNSYFVSQSTQIQPHWIHNLAVAVPPHLHSKFLFRITIHPNSTTLNPQSCSCSASSFAFQIPISYHNPPKFNHTESTILQLQCLLICIPNSYFVSQSTQIQPHWIHNLAVAVPPHLHSKFLFRITIHPNSTTLNPQSCSCSASSFAFQIPISYHNPPKFNDTESTILQLQCLLICIPNSYFVSQSTQIQPHWIHNLAVAVPPHLHSKFLFRITIHPNSTTLNPQSCSCSASSFAFQIPISYHNPPKFNHTESTILQLQCLLICIPNSYFVSQSTQIQPHWIHNLAVAVPPHLHSKFLFRITIHPNSTTLNPQSCSCSASSFAFQIPISYHNPPKFNHTESTILQLQCLLICIPNSYFVSQSTQIQPHWIHNLAVAVPPHLHSKFLFRITIHPNSTTLNPQSCSCSASSFAFPSSFAFQIPISYHNPPKFNHTESTILQLQCLLICIPNSYFVSQSTQIQPHWIHNLAVAVPPHLHSKFLFRITIHPNSTTLNPQSCSCSASSFAFQIPISYHNPPKFNHTESTILQLQCLLICIQISYFVSQSTQIQPHWIHNLAVVVPAAFALQIPISYHNLPKFNHTESAILKL